MKNLFLGLILFFTPLAIYSQDTIAHNIEWNYSGFKKLTYDYSQIMSNKNSMMDMLIEGKGKIIVAVKENNKADIIFKSIHSSFLKIDNNGDTIRERGMTVPDFFMQDMSSKGVIEGNLNSQTAILAKTLFPIPLKTLAIDSTYNQPTSMPFNIYGSQIIVKGFNYITLDSITDSIAMISTKIDVNEYSIPEDADVNYDLYENGHSNYSFELAKGYFTKGDLTISFGMKSLDSAEGKEDKFNFEELLEKAASETKKKKEEEKANIDENDKKLTDEELLDKAVSELKRMKEEEKANIDEESLEKAAAEMVKTLEERRKNDNSKEEEDQELQKIMDAMTKKMEMEVVTNIKLNLIKVE